ncbi:MAG: chloride channel protein [Sphingomicrobium sp.]
MKVYRTTMLALRALFRSSETALILLSLFCGLCAGLLTLAQGNIAHWIQSVLFGIGVGRLSEIGSVGLWRLMALPIAGAVIAFSNQSLKKRKWVPVDVVEANSLMGGAIPVRDTLFVCGQTLVSNGFGASVGLEAAYAQSGGGLASLIGQWLRLRRADLRVLVGAGAGAAVGAAFGAPLTGAFYAFEIVIGAYTPGAIAPVAGAALAAVLTTRAAGMPGYLIALPSAHAITTVDYFLYAGLATICAFVGIMTMQAVTLTEALMRRLPGPDRLRPIVGGLLLMPIAWISPQSLSAGHGALYLDLTTKVSLSFLAMVLILKIAASVLSLGSGFRGGLFFASLFLGSLVGQLFAGAVAFIPGAPTVDPSDAALIGMAALGVAIVGGPMTLSLLVLEVTHDFALTGIAVMAALVASTLVRETFGYSFSTWRLHTRGETIRSARDVGWVRNLTAGSMMREGVPEANVKQTVQDFRHRFPLGSIRRVLLVDDDHCFAGFLDTAKLYGAEINERSHVGLLAVDSDATVSPLEGVDSTMLAFSRHETEDLAVTDGHGKALGTLSENYVRRRYSEELEKVQKDLF